MANKRIKILVIDDLQDNLIILNALIKDAFPDVITLNALNGKTGLELAAKEGIPLIGMHLEEESIEQVFHQLTNPTK